MLRLAMPPARPLKMGLLPPLLVEPPTIANAPRPASSPPLKPPPLPPTVRSACCTGAPAPRAGKSSVAMLMLPCPAVANRYCCCCCCCKSCCCCRMFPARPPPPPPMAPTPTPPKPGPPPPWPPRVGKSFDRSNDDVPEPKPPMGPGGPAACGASPELPDRAWANPPPPPENRNSPAPDCCDGVPNIFFCVERAETSDRFLLDTQALRPHPRKATALPAIDVRSLRGKFPSSSRYWSSKATVTRCVGLI
mmetsp:Transcript_15235/g.44050  ORF Transcript_15235/g.44050 Transcript_15235/m.44050 type:complete len:249 (+) Transcript_15235:927-1673(+)